MAKQAIALRLAPGVLAWVDTYARSRKVSRQVVLETAVEAFKDHCSGGVPDLVAVEEAPRRVTRQPSYATTLGARQAALNDAKARRSK